MESKLSSAYVFKCHKALKLMGAPLTDWHCFEIIDYGMDSFTCELSGCTCYVSRWIDGKLAGAKKSSNILSWSLQRLGRRVMD